ncbi:MAG: dihydropteroate synthase [Nitrospinae bacterium]|nr:dihydropteroate synthase [Nitrospinota bacterium]MZH15237.1 dihydropteroate synthase [Nitrospinota bacterium]
MQPFSFSNNRGKTRFMGIINISTDSFYEKSQCHSLDEVLATAERMIREGADYLDLGAESSRPGSKPISDQEEMDKLIPVVSSLVKKVDIPVSVDTYKPAVAQEALQAGAKIINDITGLQKSSEMAEVVSRLDGGVIIMHMQGTPLTMQENPNYENVVNDVKKFLGKSVKIAEAAGILPDRIVVDPGIGFGKNQKHNLDILNNLEQFAELKKPILLGISRKSFIGNILNLPPEERLEGSLAASVIGVCKGGSILRTHDVNATRNAVKVAEAIIHGESL